MKLFTVANDFEEILHFLFNLLIIRSDWFSLLGDAFKNLLIFMDNF